MAELLGGTTIFNYSAISVVMVWMTVLLTHALALVLLVVFSGHRYADLKLLVKPEVSIVCSVLHLEDTTCMLVWLFMILQGV